MRSGPRILFLLCLLCSALPARASSIDPRAAWSSFASRHLGWSVQWSTDGASVHRAWGRGIPTAGAPDSPSQAAAIAEAFLRRQDDLTKAGQAELKLSACLKRQKVWYVHFWQVYEGVPILRTDVTVRLWEDGRVIAFGSDIHRDIALDTRPRLDADECVRFALDDLDSPGVRDEAMVGDLYVLPVAGGYRLIRWVEVSQDDPPHRWVMWVDAHSGQILNRYDRVRFGSIQGVVRSRVHPAQPGDATIDLPNAETFVRVDGLDVLTDDLGTYLAENTTGPVEVQFGLRGPYGHVLRADSPDTTRVTVNVDADTDPVVDHLWDDSNSHADERDAYYHQQKIHAYLAALDPDFTGLDWSMPINVRLAGTCNAFWNGESINFFRGGGGCNSTAQMDDVVYHEYAHAINDFVYLAAGSPGGLANGVLHEGLADITAAFITDDPIMANEFFSTGEALRSVDNDRRYPDDVVRESHRDGLILAGALWDLRERVGLAVAERLTHFARYGRPDNGFGLPFGLSEVYTEFVVELMVADDDDGDLSNGTPHSTDILQSFADHGILLSQNIEFNRLRVHDEDDSSLPTRVTVELTTTSPSVPPIDPASVQLLYTLNADDLEIALPMTFDGDITYEAQMPSLPPGTVVHYQFSAALEGYPPSRVRRHPLAPRWDFVVGAPTLVFQDVFSIYDTGWTVGDAGDTATDAVWEKYTPSAVHVAELPGGVCQSTGDHTVGWTAEPPLDLCYVTGWEHVEDEDGRTLYRENEVDGRTTLYSPVIDLSATVRPVVDFWYWFSNNLAAENAYEDPFTVQIRGGSNDRWRTVLSTTVATTDVGNEDGAPVGALEFPGWWHLTFRVRDFVEPTAHVQMRFVVEDVLGDSVVEAAIDDFRITDYPEAATALAPVALPVRTRLLEPSPNPFNPRVTLSFELAEPGRVRLKLVDLGGRTVCTLIGQKLEAGPHRTVWNGQDGRGRPVASGVYLVVLETESARDSRKITLVR